MIKWVNLPRELCHHTLGQEHSPKHRMCAGIVVMIVGVAIAKSANVFHVEVLHYTLDLCGYAVHGLGATPFIEYLIGKTND